MAVVHLAYHSAIYCKVVVVVAAVCSRDVYHYLLKLLIVSELVVVVQIFLMEVILIFPGLIFQL